MKQFSFFVSLLCIPFLLLSSENSSEPTLRLARHEWYWEYADIWPDLDLYAYAYFQPSSKNVRDYIVTQKYSSILDVPCAVGTEYFGYRAEGRSIDYYGIDVTPRFIKFAQEHGVPNITQANIEKIPYADCKFDVVFVRYMLEHTRHYKKALAEVMRVGKKEVIVVFGLPPGPEEDSIDYSLQEHSALFNNRYNKEKLEAFVRAHPKVSHIVWEVLKNTIPEGDEAILHIYLKE